MSWKSNSPSESNASSNISSFDGSVHTPIKGSSVSNDAEVENSKVRHTTFLYTFKLMSG